MRRGKATLVIPVHASDPDGEAPEVLVTQRRCHSKIHAFSVAVPPLADPGGYVRSG